jgi:acetoin utilization deacetylase AcuC-like enzyme
MTTAFITHASCLLHEMNDDHPESPQRLQAILDALRTDEFSSLLRLDAPRATLDNLALAHDPIHIKTIMDHIPQMGLNFIDRDTMVCKHSGEAALHAAGAVIAAVDSVISGTATNAFCAVRPPGHHAYHNKSGGFCLFNNIAIGAKYALQKPEINRVAILDFDVHHGNGTQDIVWDDADIFFASIHQSPFYPLTGEVHERGAHDNVMNVPLPAGTTGNILKTLFTNQILPRLHHFQPDLIFVSAGYDGHKNDPLGGWNLTEADYAWMMQSYLDSAKALCNNRLVAVLEGGYNTHALANSVAASLRPMMHIT